jgi:hypothetical protein
MIDFPDKRTYCIAEVAPKLAEVLEISENAARCRIYRALCNGQIKGRRHLGSYRLPREEVIRILEGEPIT